MEPILFWIFATLAVIGASLVVLLSNPVRSAMCLVGTLFCIAVLFVLLEAHLIAALEVLVYAGAVMVLFLFVIMLLNLREEELGSRQLTIVKTLAFVAAVGVGIMLGGVLASQALPLPTLDASFGTVEEVGRLLMRGQKDGTYMLAFELTSILLLIAVVGAVILAKRKV